MARSIHILTFIVSLFSLVTFSSLTQAEETAHAIETVTVFGQDFPTKLLATTTSPELYLQGASVRKVYGIVNTYVGLLYVGEKKIQADQIVAADITRRMEFHLLSNRVTSRRFVNVIEEGLALNTTREEMEQIEPRVQQLFKLFDYKFMKGTIGWIEWVPEEQVSRVVINGEIKGAVPGKDLSDALLRIWIGDHPVSERFKREVSGASTADSLATAE